MKKLISFDLDVIGMSASLLCAIHCALVPLILTFGLLGGVSFLADPLWDVVFIGLSFILAAASLLNGYRNHHGMIGPLALAISGFLAIIFGHMIFHDLAGDILSVAGGLGIAYAHLMNYRACRTCTRCRD